MLALASEPELAKTRDGLLIKAPNRKLAIPDALRRAC